MKSTFLTIAVALFALTCQAQQIEVPFVYDVENTGSCFAPATMPDYEDLPVIRELPDALEGVNDFSDWAKRRSYIGQMIQHYGIGTKPSAETCQMEARHWY